MPIVVSTISFALLIAGVLLRRRVHLHVPLLLTAFALDVGLLIFLQLTRGAIQTVLTQPNPPLLYFHVATSVGMLIGWGAMLFLGWKLLRGKDSIRPVHRVGAAIFLLFRLANYTTSFLI